MIAVIFEVQLAAGHEADYLAHAARLRPLLEADPGFLGVERFRSLTQPDKLLSLSFFADEAAVARWRALPQHRHSQTEGRAGIFADYRLRVAAVQRDYGLTNRTEAPADSRSWHGPNVQAPLGKNEEIVKPGS